MTDQVSPGYRGAGRERRTVGLAVGLVLDVAVIWAVAAYGRDALER
jgi:hypothetical protein